MMQRQCFRVRMNWIVRELKQAISAMLCDTCFEKVVFNTEELTETQYMVL